MDPIDYYNKYAAKVFEDTVDENMDDITSRFLEMLEEGDTILDMGCGSGRDSLTFYNLGYDVTPLDLSLIHISQVVVGHHRIAPVFLHTKNCHLVVNSFHLE